VAHPRVALATAREAAEESEETTMSDDKYFDVDPELAEYRHALNAAWVLIGRLDMTLEQIQSPHLPAKAKRDLIAKVRAEIKRASVSKVVS
jgi:hypothetical protein